MVQQPYGDQQYNHKEGNDHSVSIGGMYELDRKLSLQIYTISSEEYILKH